MEPVVLPAVAPVTDRIERPAEYYLPLQQLVRQLAFSPSSWSPQHKAEITKRFDDLAPEWHTRGGEERLAPTRDALRRGGIPRGGTALEIGSGTGLQTGVLREHFDHVVSLDLSPAMLGLTPRREGVSVVRADAAQLPVRSTSVEAVVCVNAFLFPDECARVLARTGAVVFVSTSGDQTPIYLPPSEVVTALTPALEPSGAFTASVGWGLWTTVLRMPRD